MIPAAQEMAYHTDMATALSRLDSRVMITNSMMTNGWHGCGYDDCVTPKAIGSRPSIANGSMVTQENPNVP
jgi:hypothetical protein